MFSGTYTTDAGSIVQVRADAAGRIGDACMLFVRGAEGACEQCVPVIDFSNESVTWYCSKGHKGEAPLHRVTRH